MDGKLDESLGSFDDQLRKEQQRTAEERDARAAGRASETVVDEAQRSGQEQASTGRDRSGDLKSEGSQQGGGNSGNQSTASMPQGGGGAAASNAIPSGEDDDIIARRLRKAAETETDPELKEKLWKEYRDYKENTRGGA